MRNRPLVERGSVLKGARPGCECLLESACEPVQWRGGPGTPGTIANYNLGRTATHEIGHWLNLRHIWGDQTCGNDFVTDTPTQASSNFSCPNFPKLSNNCSGNPPNGDMFMNYMDYVDDDSMFMFTPGQVARMRTTLDGPRNGLVT